MWPSFRGGTGYPDTAFSCSECRGRNRCVKFSAEGYLDGVCELSEPDKGEAHLLFTDDWRSQGRRAVRPLKGKPDVPPTRVLSIDVSLAVLASNRPDDQEFRALQRMDR